MPAIRNEVISKPRPAGPIACPICDKVLNRKPDLARHMLLHNESAERYTCEYEGCVYSTLQKSNFATHVGTHTGEKRHVCKDDPSCTFRTADPAALIRHRKRMHGYIPRSRKSKSAPAEPDATAGLSSLSARPSTSTGAVSTTTATTTTHFIEEYYDYSSHCSSSDRSSSASIKSEEFYRSPLGPAAGFSSGSCDFSVSGLDDWVLSLDGSPQGPKHHLPTEEYLKNLNSAELQGPEFPWGTSLWSSPPPASSSSNIFKELFCLPETTTWNPVEQADPCDWMFKDSMNMLPVCSPMPVAPLDSTACSVYFKDDQGYSLVAPVSFGEDYMQMFDFGFGVWNNNVYTRNA